MENRLIVIAKREDPRRNFYGSLSSFGILAAFLAMDIVFYVRDKYTWELVLLIISAILAGFALLGLLFTLSTLSYANKIINTPLMAYDEDKKVFIVTDCIFHKEIEVNKDDAIEIKTSDKGETYLWHMKDGKKTSTFIGYSSKGSEYLVNTEIQKYKNMN